MSFLSNVPCQDNSCPECSALVSLLLQDPPSHMEPLCAAIAPGAGWLAGWLLLHHGGLWARCGSVLQAQEMLCAQQRVGPVLGTWDLLGSELYCRLCSWKSYASVKLESMGQSPSHINYRQFYVRKCKEPPRVRRKVHLITLLSLATAKWGSLERSARTERACSNPSPEFSPKIQGFQAVAVSLYSRVLHRSLFFIVHLPFLEHAHIFTFIPVRRFLQLNHVLCHQESRLLWICYLLISFNAHSSKWELHLKTKGSLAQHAVCTEMCAAWANGNHRTEIPPVRALWRHISLLLKLLHHCRKSF